MKDYFFKKDSQKFNDFIKNNLHYGSCYNVTILPKSKYKCTYGTMNMPASSYP